MAVEVQAHGIVQKLFLVIDLLAVDIGDYFEHAARLLLNFEVSLVVTLLSHDVQLVDLLEELPLARLRAFRVVEVQRRHFPKDLGFLQLTLFIRTQELVHDVPQVVDSGAATAVILVGDSEHG